MSAGEKLSAVLGGVKVPRPTNDATPADHGLAFESRRLDAGGGSFVSLWVIDRPAARGCVVLAPGYASAKSSLLPEAAAFHRLGWAVVLLDYRGAGDSSGNTTTLGLQEGVDVTLAAHKAWELYRDRPLVGYGVSIGAAAVLQSNRLYLIQPFSGVALEAPFDDLPALVRSQVRAAGLPEWPAADLLLYWGGKQHQCDGFAHRPVSDAAFVDRPARVLHGSVDPVATPAMAEAVCEQFYGPKKRICFDGAGPMIRSDPARWEAAMAEFLADVVRAYAPPARGPMPGPNGEQPDPAEVMMWMKGRKK
jgi:alpha-beta hydrolase superfamily lysophospholipase